MKYSRDIKKQKVTQFKCANLVLEYSREYSKENKTTLGGKKFNHVRNLPSVAELVVETSCENTILHRPTKLQITWSGIAFVHLRSKTGQISIP